MVETVKLHKRIALNSSSESSLHAPKNGAYPLFMEQVMAQPTSWVDTVFQALRAYRRPVSDNIPSQFQSLLLMTEALCAPDAPRGVVAPGWAMRRVLEEAVAELAEREPEMADLLATRFFQGKSVIAAAQALGLSESSIYYRQKQAIQLLADVLILREQKVTTTPVPASATVATSLPPPTYGRLFGLTEKIATLQKALMLSEPPWQILILGLGGMGKTTLAHAVATWAAQDTSFAHIIWLTAKQEEYSTWLGQRRPVVEPTTDQHLLPSSTGEQAPLTYEKLLDAIAAQLGLHALTRSDALSERSDRQSSTYLPQKLERIRAVLQEQPALLVLDNFESVAHDMTLVQGIGQLAHPSKVLFTSRHAIDLPEMLLLRMDELTWEDSRTLLCYEAQQRAFAELCEAPPTTLFPLYELVGGNPLALKLVVGQLTSLPFTEVIARLTAARKGIERAEYELYHYLYSQSWQLLSDQARELMLVMPVLPQRGAEWDTLLQVSGLSRTQLSEAITELTRHSLLNTGGWPDKHYSIHQLTHTFLMTEVLKWW